MIQSSYCLLFVFFFNDTATTEIYTLSLHDALPICTTFVAAATSQGVCSGNPNITCRSEEHTSELQSRPHIVCRLLLEKKKTIIQSVYKITKVDEPNNEFNIQSLS